MHVPVARKPAALIAALALAASAIFILWLGAATDIDLRLADAAFDRASASFPMQHAWIAEQFNHVILKSLLSAVGAGFILLALWDSWRPYAGWQPPRRIGVRVTAMSAVLVPSVISVLKYSSSSHCPWDCSATAARSLIYGSLNGCRMAWQPATACRVATRPAHCG